MKKMNRGETLELIVRKLGRIDYMDALRLQEELVIKRQEQLIPDTLLLLEHPPVITLGRRGKYSNIKVPPETLKQNNTEIYETDRGGDVTYHGPGQIVGYPIFDLKKHGRDIKQFVWNIEEVFIRMLKEQFNIEAHREGKEYTGVWVGKDKITAIGISVKKWVTMHGFAFNVNTNLDHFDWIIPCGLNDRGVTSLQKLVGKHMDFDEIMELTADYFCKIFNMTGRDYNAG